MQLWKDSDAMTLGYWHRATPNAKVLEGESVFRARFTWNVDEALGGAGEQMAQAHPYYKGQNPAHYGGYQMCGKVADMVEGAIAASTPALGPTGVDGELACCFKPAGLEWANFLFAGTPLAEQVQTLGRTGWCLSHQYAPVAGLAEDPVTPHGWEVIFAFLFDAGRQRIDLFRHKWVPVEDLPYAPAESGGGNTFQVFSFFGNYAELDGVAFIPNEGTTWAGPGIETTASKCIVLRATCTTSAHNLSPIEPPGERLGGATGIGGGWGAITPSVVRRFGPGMADGWGHVVSGTGPKKGVCVSLVFKEPEV